MLRDGGWSELGLECGGGMKVKDVLASQVVLGEEGFLKGW